MKAILDIDDTLTYPSPYQNYKGKDNFTLTPAFGELLAEAPLAPYWKTMSNRLMIGNPVYYVTGRHAAWDLVTKTWLFTMGFPRGDVIYLNFDNYKQYLEDKTNAIIKLIAGSEPALVIDDNAEILQQLKKLMPDHHYLQMIEGIELYRI